jgi:isopenicillin N synthase-like dioxygenase
MTTIPVLSLTDAPARLTQALGESFRSYGFAMVRDHGIDADLIAEAWAMSKAFFAQDDAAKRRYHLAGKGGARGYTPFGTEIAKDALVHDLKEFWHVGRDLPPGHPLSSSMPANVWPDAPAGFQDTFTRLYTEFDRVGLVLLRHIAIDLGLAENWFDEACHLGNSVLRLIHYPPLAGDPAGALRAGPHEDINLITLLLGAEEAGLELLGKDGQWHGVNPPPGGLVVNIGDMLQRLCNHVLPSTTHRVRNPLGERVSHARYSMPYFVHLRSDVLIQTLPGCATAANPDRYPEPILADDFLKERLHEIGLLG